jgi:hypothetical protein
MQEMSREPAWAGVPIAWTMSPWQCRQAASAMARLVGVAWMGSWKLWVVK